MVARSIVIWSAEAVGQVELIKDFIGAQWTQREVSVFLDLLQEFQALVVRFPNDYQRSELYPGCRRAVIHPNVSVVYRVNKDLIEVVTVYDNRSGRSTVR